MQPEVIEIGEVEDVMVGQEDEGRSNVRKCQNILRSVKVLLFSHLGGSVIFCLFDSNIILKHYEGSSKGVFGKS